MISTSYDLATELSVNLRASNQYFALYLEYDEDILICDLVSLENAGFCQSQTKGLVTCYSCDQDKYTFKYLCCSELQVGTQGIKMCNKSKKWRTQSEYGHTIYICLDLQSNKKNAHTLTIYKQGLSIQNKIQKISYPPLYKKPHSIVQRTLTTGKAWSGLVVVYSDYLFMYSDNQLG